MRLQRRVQEVVRRSGMPVLQKEGLMMMERVPAANCCVLFLAALPEKRYRTEEMPQGIRKSLIHGLRKFAGTCVWFPRLYLWRFGGFLFLSHICTCHSSSFRSCRVQKDNIFVIQITVSGRYGNEICRYRSEFTGIYPWINS